MRWTSTRREKRTLSVPTRLSAWITAALLGCALLGLSATPLGQNAPSAPAQTAPEQPPAAPSQTETPKPAAPEFFVLIDAGHGGDDSGAIFRNKLAEKDVTLSFARQLRSALENRGIGARMMRDSDTTVSLERRAEAANGQHTGIYIALHAGMPGTGVRVYAPLLPAQPQGTTGRFIPWDTAQTASLPRSKAIADAVAKELEKTDFQVTRLSAPLRPLNNVVAPAIAVEIAAEPDDPQALASARMQSAVASAVASGIARSRGQAGAQ